MLLNTLTWVNLNLSMEIGNLLLMPVAVLHHSLTLLLYSLCQVGFSHPSPSETPRLAAILSAAAASVRPGPSICSSPPCLHTLAPFFSNVSPNHALAPLGSSWVAPTSPFSIALALAPSSTVSGRDIRAETKVVRHLPRPEATDWPDPKGQPIHERPERPVGAAAGIKRWPTHMCNLFTSSLEDMKILFYIKTMDQTCCYWQKVFF